MALYYNESPFVNGETILDSAHFNPMSEAISFSCCQIIEEGNPNEADVGIMFDMVLAGANVCCAFTENVGTNPRRRYSTETIYKQSEGSVSFRWVYVDTVDGVSALVSRDTAVYRDATWETSQVAYQLTAINDN